MLTLVLIVVAFVLTEFSRLLTVLTLVLIVVALVLTEFSRLLTVLTLVVIVVALVLTEFRRLLIVVTLLLTVSTAPLLGMLVNNEASPTNFPYTVPAEIVEKNP